MYNGKIFCKIEASDELTFLPLFNRLTQVVFFLPIFQKESMLWLQRNILP
jgi:hypothetical protein